MSNNTKRTYKRFSYNDRIQLEALLRANTPIKSISKILGFHLSSIYLEIKRGTYKHLDGNTWLYINKYSADKGQQHATFNRTTQGRQPILQKDYEFVAFIETMIKTYKKSPAAILMHIKEHNLQFQTKVCLSTIYNYIRKGYFLHISEKDLWLQGKRKKKKQKREAPKNKNLKGTSIEQRPLDINERSAFGHWEIDSIIGKRESGQTLITLTERKTRYELIFKTKGKTAVQTQFVIDLLKKIYKNNFYKIFKSITCDNGTEFSSLYKLNIAVYYCHPYSSWERGTNENTNGFVRRFIPKGTRIETISIKRIAEIQHFINNYERAILNGKTSQQLFDYELSKLQ